MLYIDELTHCVIKDLRVSIKGFLQKLVCVKAFIDCMATGNVSNNMFHVYTATGPPTIMCIYLV